MVSQSVEVFYKKKTTKYTVKSGYWTERNDPSSGKLPSHYGPDIRPPEAHIWNLKCSPKLRHLYSKF